MPDLTKLSSYQYTLPEELIADAPAEPRDHSRLMVVDRTRQTLTETQFYRIGDFLQKGDRLVFNDTKVIPARLFGKKPTGGEVEILLLRPRVDGDWEALAHPGKRLQPGAEVIFSSTFSAIIVANLTDGHKQIRLRYVGDLDKVLEAHGQMPLPPYIKSRHDTDKERYQTVYAKNPGAVAAPTAGLHFTPTLLHTLRDQGLEMSYVTLHIGAGTFKPVQTEEIQHHKMHTEWASLSSETAHAIALTTGRVVAVGTTSLRTLESATGPGDFETSIFITPGYHFQQVDALLTNFHIPGSTLLMLVAAFAGYDLTMRAYALAIASRFRFYSYGDAMLIL